MCDLEQMLKKQFGDRAGDFTIQVDGNFKNENGVTAKILYVTIYNEKTGVRQYCIVKQEKPGQGYIYEKIREMIINEIHFYTNIWKTFIEIYEEKTGKELTIIPYCNGISEEGLMKIALENITIQGFIEYDKTHFFDNDHIVLIYKTYGLFHGLSMILKHRSIEEYLRLVTPLHTAYKYSFEDDGYFTPRFKGVMTLVKEFFDPLTEGLLLEIIDLFASVGHKLVYEVLCQNLEDGVIVHGDCWSNNFMFKYQVSEFCSIICVLKIF